CCEQKRGSLTGLGTCNSSNNNPCKGTFRIQQRAYAAFNDDSDPPDDSGFVVSATASEPGVWSTGANSFQAGSTHTLVVQFKVSRFQISQPTDKPIVIRYSNQNNTDSHETALFD